jgi:ABC-2 type transport system ATP-binding protein
MIRVQNLVKRFGDLTAVNDISFEVHRGEVFAFLGPNGAGKTTTIKMLTTLLRPTSGVLKLDGLDPSVERDKVRHRFGVVFQDPSLDQDLTAWENMEIHGVLYGVPRKERRERAEALMKLFELWGRRDALVKTFSGGMRLAPLKIPRGRGRVPRARPLSLAGILPAPRRKPQVLVNHLAETCLAHAGPFRLVAFAYLCATPRAEHLNLRRALLHFDFDHIRLPPGERPRRGPRAAATRLRRRASWQTLRGASAPCR